VINAMSNASKIRITILEPLLPTVVSIFLASALSFLLQTNPTLSIKIQPFHGTGLLRDVTNALFFVGLGTVLMIFVYFLFERTDPFFKRIVVALLISPTILVVTVFFGQTILLMFFKNNPNILLSLLTLFTIYLSIFSAILILTDVLSENVRNLILLFYGSSLGVFLGFSLPTVSTIFLLITLGIEDYLLISRSTIPQESFTSGIHSYFSVTQKGFKLGIGDLVLVPALTAHSLTNFGIELYIASVVLLVLGVVANFVIAQKQQGGRVFPGLLLPTLLGVLPMTLHIISS
jgi:hypothetical protein